MHEGVLASLDIYHNKGEEPMPLYDCVITKSINTQEWTNTYVVDAPTLQAARDIGVQIAAIELDVHQTYVEHRRLRTSSRVVGDDEYIITALIGNGTYSTSGDAMPLFNVVRVDFNADSGRPSRKYLRGVLGEGDINFNALGATVIARAQAYANALVALDGYVDVDGQQLISAVVSSTVGMRQLRRGSKRRVLPTIPPPPLP